VRWRGRAAHAPEAASPPSDGAPSLRHTALPFGPFLAAAALVYLFAEPAIKVQSLVVGP